MIHSQLRNPNIGGMTRPTFIGRRDMGQTLALRLLTIVAIHAFTYDFFVIHLDEGGPKTCGMARSAIIRRADMGRTLTSYRIAIVAGDASAFGLRMIDAQYRFPFCWPWRVTGLAHIGGGDVA